MDQILKDTVMMYNEYIQKLVKGSKLIERYLRENQIPEALELIHELAEGIDWLQEVNRLLKLNNVKGYLDIEIIKIELGEINTALNQQDYILLADIFEYEIEPFFANYFEIKL